MCFAMKSPALLPPSFPLLPAWWMIFVVRSKKSFTSRWGFAMFIKSVLSEKNLRMRDILSHFSVEGARDMSLSIMAL